MINDVQVTFGFFLFPVLSESFRTSVSCPFIVPFSTLKISAPRKKAIEIREKEIKWKYLETNLFGKETMYFLYFVSLLPISRPEYMRAGRRKKSSAVLGRRCHGCSSKRVVRIFSRFTTQQRHYCLRKTHVNIVKASSFSLGEQRRERSNFLKTFIKNSWGKREKKTKKKTFLGERSMISFSV